MASWPSGADGCIKALMDEKDGATGGTCTHTLDLMKVLLKLFELPWHKSFRRPGLIPARPPIREQDPCNTSYLIRWLESMSQ